MNKFLFGVYVVLAATSAAIGLFLATSVLLIDTRQPLENLSISPLVKQVSVGGTLPVRATRTKVRDDCSLISLRAVRNARGMTILLPSRAYKGGTAEAPFFDYEYDTSALPVGDYRGLYNLAFFCGTVWRTSYEYEGEFTEDFEVVP